MPPSRHIGSVRFRAAPTFFFSPDYGEWRQLAVERFGTLRARRLLRVVTWNVLCDQFEAELIASEQRVPAVCRALERLAPDVIALQEVTRAQWDALLNEEWVRRSYFASFAPGERALDPYGQAILARLPFHTHLHALSRNKMVVAAEMCVNGRMLLVPCVHLTR
jgi:endonuclease/exonuclease/phosphatase family metal-dependent hydrolase